MEFQHIILTRFNILLWDKAKDGRKVRTASWLDHRFLLFEKYCLPSVKNQSCQEFEWIVLFDSMTPDSFKERIVSCQKECPQFVPVFVEPENGRNFVDIFRTEIVKRVKAKRVITTYLDNDDALNVKFIEDLQHRAVSIDDDTFIYYDDGYQLYTDYKYVMGIKHPRNHFVSYVEKGDPATVKGVFCYGTHYYIYTVKGVKIEHIRKKRMWCEVVHEKNMQNDAYFLNAQMVHNGDLLRREFAINETVRSGLRIYLFKFLPRYCRVFIRRTKNCLLEKGIIKRRSTMVLKWIFDRIVSFIGLLFLWPVLLVVAILVKIKMPGGPAFFVQKRVGKDGRLFDCHKFRTMTVKHSGSTVSVAGDSRITPFGATLRHYKLDELPGLWDVLIGNMSFVGPRPDVPGYADKLEGDDGDVLKLRPGITGPATLKYRLEDEMLTDVRRLMSEGRHLPQEQIDRMTDQELAVWYNDNVIYPDKVRLNCYYYRHYSFIKDIQMILCTVLGKQMSYAGETI